jgi:hypothetical protein
MTAQADVKPVEQEKVVAEKAQAEAAKPIEKNNNEQANNVQQPQEESSPKSSKEWNNFREARQAERKQAEEIAKQAKKSQEEAIALKAALDAVLNKPQHHQPQYNQETDVEETEEQRIDKRVNEALARREAELDKRRKEQEMQEFPQRISRDFKDFNQVCSADNLDYLEYHYPEVSQAFQHMPDGYEKWSAIYKAVKRFIPNPDARKDQSKAEKNMQKPQSTSNSVLGQTGTNMAGFKLDEKKKAENWARMQKLINKIE